MELRVVVFALLTTVPNQLAMAVHLIQFLSLYPTEVTFVKDLTAWCQYIFVFLQNFYFNWFKFSFFILVEHVLEKNLRWNQLKSTVHDDAVVFFAFEF